jgi:hypothetical protein
MPVIKSKVLTTGNQGLESAQKQQARSNIDAAKKLDIASSADPRVGKNILVPDADGEIDISDKSIDGIPPAPPAEDYHVFVSEGGSGKWAKCEFKRYSLPDGAV